MQILTSLLILIKKNICDFQQGGSGQHEVPFVPRSGHQLREFTLRPHVHLCVLLEEGKQMQRLQQGEICLHRSFFVGDTFGNAQAVRLTWQAG
jgi:hypothetical protein